jgi:hypothetical protein
MVTMSSSEHSTTRHILARGRLLGSATFVASAVVVGTSWLPWRAMYFRRGPSAAFHTVTGVNDFIGLLTVPLGAFMIAVSLSYLIGRISLVVFGGFAVVVSVIATVASTVYVLITRHDDLTYSNTRINGILQHIRAGPWITLTAGLAIAVVGLLALRASWSDQPIRLRL